MPAELPMFDVLELFISSSCFGESVFLHAEGELCVFSCRAMLIHLGFSLDFQKGERTLRL